MAEMNSLLSSWRWFPAVLALWFSPISSGQEILFFGNSFTFGGNEADVEAAGGVPQMVEGIGKANGLGVSTRMVASGGKDWNWHLENRQTAAALRERKWSHVVIQDFSTRPTAVGDPAAFRRDGERFYRLIRELAPDAKIVLYQTWARASGHSIYGQDGVADFADMDRQLLRGYVGLEHFLEELEEGDQVLRAPVGTAFARYAHQHDEVSIYGSDLYHANANGSYLAALVISGTVFEIDPTASPLTFGTLEIPSAIGSRLQEIAAELVGPGAAPMRQAMRPSVPFRVWSSAGDVISHAPMFENLTIDASGREDPRALEENGKVGLDWIYGSQISRQDGSAYWFNNASLPRRIVPATAAFPYPYITAGVSVDAWSTTEFSEVWDWIPEGLRAAKMARPETFVAIWVGNLDQPQLFELGHDGTVDLFLVQGYTIAAGSASRVSWQQVLERLERFEKRGLIRKTVVALGPISDLPDATTGERWNEESLRNKLTELRKRFPGMPGIAFHVPGPRDTPEYRELVAICDRLSGEFWPALPISEGSYELILQSVTDLRLQAALASGVGLAPTDGPSATAKWRVRRLQNEAYEIRPASQPERYLAVTENGLELKDGEADAMGEWVFEAVPHGYRLRILADTERYLSRAKVDLPVRMAADAEPRESTWALTPTLDEPAAE
jgi:hypothetical protein